MEPSRKEEFEESKKKEALKTQVMEGDLRYALQRSREELGKQGYCEATQGVVMLSGHRNLCQRPCQKMRTRGP